MVGEMVGSKGSKGAIVYGAYSFFDKISNGIIIFCIMNSSYFKERNVTFVRIVATTVPGLSGVLAWAIAFFVK